MSEVTISSDVGPSFWYMASDGTLRRVDVPGFSMDDRERRIATALLDYAQYLLTQPDG